MKTLVEVSGEGLESLLNTNVLLYGLNYIYTGKLVGVNASFVKLEDAKIVYETGPYSGSGYKLAESLPTKTWYVNISAIESFGPGK